MRRAVAATLGRSSCCLSSRIWRFANSGPGCGSDVVLQQQPSYFAWAVARLYSAGSVSSQCVIVGEELATKVLVGEENVAAAVHHESEETEEKEAHPSLTKTAAVAFALDFPKLENPTTILINRVCKLLDVQEWGPETEKELEAANVTLTPFIVQIIVHKVSNNVDLAWNFFQWARAKIVCKMSMRAHVVMLDTLGRAKKFDVMKHAFTLIYEDGHRRSAWPYNNALKWCSEAKDVESALFFWSKMHFDKCRPTVVTYTNLIDLLAKQGRHQDALKIFRQMLQDNCPPNVTTYNVLINALGIAGQLEVASSVFDKMSELGCKPNYSTYNILIKLHVEAGRPEKALKFVNSMKAAGMTVGNDVYRALDMTSPNRNELASTRKSANSDTGDTAAAFASHLDIDFSLPDSSTRRLIHPDRLVKLLEKGDINVSLEASLEKIRPLISPRFVVQVLRRLKNPDIALEFFFWAKAQPNFQHNEYSYSMIINILGRTRNNVTLDRILREMQTEGLILNTPVFTALITCYGRAKSIEGALKLFEVMQEQGCKPDVISYTSIIHLLAKHGYFERAVETFQEMLQAGIKPNMHSYSVMIYNYLKAGKVTEALSLLNDMQRLGCQPSSITFATLIDYCAKEGLLDTAKDLCSQMEDDGIKPLRKTIVVLDSAFRKVGRSGDADELSEKFKHRRFWDETYKLSTGKWAQELLFKDLAKDEPETEFFSVKVKSETQSVSI